LTKIKNDVLINLFNHAVDTSKKAGDYIFRNASANLDIDFKGRADMVTQIDKESENIIQNEIINKYPNHQIMGEELTDRVTKSDIKWFVDPVDGTTNFVHGHNMVAVSIGIEHQGELIIGVVYNPFIDELFTAIKNHGAYLNGRQIEVSRVDKIKDGLFATGFPYELNDYFYTNMELFKRIYENSQGVRRAGSAALDICYTACGRFDGFWEYDLNPWDMAAGSLILSEAGGQLSNFSGGEFSIHGDEILAANSKLKEPMLNIIQNVISNYEK